MQTYRITTQRELRREFWRTFPHLPRKQVEYLHGYSYYPCDTRMAFVDWIDSLERTGDISPELAGRATL